MLLLEFYDPKQNSGTQDLEDDNSRPSWGSSRKTKLTLKMINKLRRARDVQAFERSKDLVKIRKQYQPPAQEGGL
jgi:hypothetical protein